MSTTYIHPNGIISSTAPAATVPNPHYRAASGTVGEEGYDPGTPDEPTTIGVQTVTVGAIAGGLRASLVTSVQRSLVAAVREDSREILAEPLLRRDPAVRLAALAIDLSGVVSE